MNCNKTFRDFSSTTKYSKNRGFTLAEILIVISTLGIIAIITIPSILNKITDITDRVKIKKAFSTYQQFIQTYISANEFASDAQVYSDWIHNNDKCSILTSYFNIKKIISSNKLKCEFETSDGLIWKFSRNNYGTAGQTIYGLSTTVMFKNSKNIKINNNEIILPNGEKLNYFNFYFHIDPSTSSLYVNDPNHIPWIPYPGTKYCQMTASGTCTTTSKNLDATASTILQYLGLTEYKEYNPDF